MPSADARIGRGAYIPAMTIVRVIDLETTGGAPPADAVVELGWQDVTLVDGVWQVTEPGGAVFVDPGRPIPSRTMAIHHIMDADVAGAPGWLAAAGPVLAAPGVVALAAHRAAFERKWCTDALTGGLPWVCTWKSALRLWPELPSHSNQVLRYERLPAGLERGRSLPAHRAGPDAYVSAFHLRDQLNEAGLEQLVAWSAVPALLARVPYGPLRGRRWDALDAEALATMLNASDRDVRYTAQHWAGLADGAPPEGLLL